MRVVFFSLQKKIENYWETSPHGDFFSPYSKGLYIQLKVPVPKRESGIASLKFVFGALK